MRAFESGEDRARAIPTTRTREQPRQVDRDVFVLGRDLVGSLQQSNRLGELLSSSKMTPTLEQRRDGIGRIRCPQSQAGDGFPQVRFTRVEGRGLSAKAQRVAIEAGLHQALDGVPVADLRIGMPTCLGEQGRDASVDFGVVRVLFEDALIGFDRALGFALLASLGGFRKQLASIEFCRAPKQRCHAIRP